VISVDEKTAIQAIERDRSTTPQSKGGIKEYTRHGTTTLIAANNVENGKVIHRHLGLTRTEEDYAIFLKETMPEMDDIVFLSDQLNTHVSETLVIWIAEMEEYHQEEIGVKGNRDSLRIWKLEKSFLKENITEFSSYLPLNTVLG